MYNCCPSARGPGPNQLWGFSSAAELLFLNSAHVCVHQPKGSFLCHPQEHHPPVRQVLSSGVEQLSEAGWWAAPGVLLSAFPLHGFWWIHSGSGTCKASTSLTDLSPQPQFFFFSNFIAKKIIKLQLQVSDSWVFVWIIMDFSGDVLWSQWLWQRWMLC